MTLHLTRISRSYTLQVSDRLVSGGVQDPLANKTLIYWARGGVVSIGYTGLAYELSSCDPNIPTDELIAEILFGMPIPRGRDGVRPVTLGIGKIPRWLDLGQSIELLRCELQNSVDRLPSTRREYPFEMIVAGWQETRRRGLQPVIVQIIKPRGNAAFTIERPQRNWHLGGSIALITTPEGYVSDNELSGFTEHLPTASPDESENLLVDGVRRVSSRNPQSVGPHCMSILLPPLGVAPIRVRFIPNAPHTAVYTGQDQNMTPAFPIAFSPWIIGPNMLCAPSVQIGHGQVQMGPFEIVMEAPMPESGVKGYMGALERPPGPRIS